MVAVAQETQERSPPDLEAHAHQLNPVFSALTKWTMKSMNISIMLSLSMLAPQSLKSIVRPER